MDGHASWQLAISARITCALGVLVCILYASAPALNNASSRDPFGMPTDLVLVTTPH